MLAFWRPIETCRMQKRQTSYDLCRPRSTCHASLVLFDLALWQKCMGSLLIARPTDERFFFFFVCCFFFFSFSSWFEDLQGLSPEFLRLQFILDDFCLCFWASICGYACQHMGCRCYQPTIRLEDIVKAIAVMCRTIAQCQDQAGLQQAPCQNRPRVAGAGQVCHCASLLLQMGCRTLSAGQALLHRICSQDLAASSQETYIFTACKVCKIVYCNDILSFFIGSLIHSAPATDDFARKNLPCCNVGWECSVVHSEPYVTQCEGFAWHIWHQQCISGLQSQEEGCCGCGWGLDWSLLHDRGCGWLFRLSEGYHGATAGH